MIFVVKKQMGGMLFGVIIVCLCSIVGITVSILAAKLIDSREKGNGIKKRLAEKHPNINTLIGLFFSVYNSFGIMGNSLLPISVFKNNDNEIH